MKTLILCAANVCRSPAAEALWRVMATERGLRDPVASAGLQARPGQARSSQMLYLLAAAGLAPPEQGASPFIRAVACRHELILVMEPAQQRQVLALAPELTGRVHLLGRWGQGPIADPTGGPVEGYAACLEQLSSAVESWVERLVAPTRRAPAARVAEPVRATHAVVPVHA